LYKIVKGALDEAGLEPHRLELEITETVLLRDEAKVHRVLHKLREVGVQIALDDFGTAYASLSYLRSFPFDTIKIDRSFMRDLNDPQRPDCVAIINAVVALAKQLKMSTVAEGVETRDHLRTVSEVGCERRVSISASPYGRARSKGSSIESQSDWLPRARLEPA
jgi:EAL domain-containing protein (putative c-di-GMP-specific phosphodiesterase class I)